MAEHWSWKPADASAPGLLYEPGNWGDLLKGLWVVAIVRQLLAVPNAADAAFVLVDPFAGAHDYPLTPGARRRLGELGNAPGADRLRTATADGRWPSAALLAADAAEAGGRAVRGRVFDAHAERAASFDGDPRFERIAARDGYAAAVAHAPPPNGLLLIDPYDFLGEWAEQIDTILRAARTTSVLLYLYNRSARGAKYLRAYRDFRNALERGRGEAPYCIGRTPADGFLPSAHHEIVFLPGPGVLDGPAGARLCTALRTAAAATEAAAASPATKS
ncbi:MAG: hypothetical protein ACOCX4_05750 [Planctomycetota bacterium]